MSHPPLEGLSYSQIAALVEERLGRDTASSSDASGVLPFARAEWEEHQPKAKTIGEECAECGETWPCNAIRLILASE